MTIPPHDDQGAQSPPEEADTELVVLPVLAKKSASGAKVKKPAKESVYRSIIIKIFEDAHTPGADEVPFSRADITDAAIDLGLDVPANLGDVVYQFRYRRALPDAIATCAPKGTTWVIRGRGAAKYAFAASTQPYIVPNAFGKVIKIPDATPGLIAQHALTTEQALLAKVRYNRLIDIFTGITCYSLQNHLRTQVAGVGQLETDEVYLGVDRSGIQYAIPVEAKGGSDKLSIVQIDQDLELCRAKFDALVHRPVGAQFVGDDIALFLFEPDPVTQEAVFVREARYRLVPPDGISPKELLAYREGLPPIT